MQIGTLTRVDNQHDFIIHTIYVLQRPQKYRQAIFVNTKYGRDYFDFFPHIILLQPKMEVPSISYFKQGER